jgi:hypothetical protein
VREALDPDALGGWAAKGDGALRGFDADSLVVVGDEAHAGIGADAGLVEEDEQLGVALVERCDLVVGAFCAF